MNEELYRESRKETSKVVKWVGAILIAAVGALWGTMVNLFDEFRDLASTHGSQYAELSRKLGSLEGQIEEKENFGREVLVAVSKAILEKRE